MMEPPEAMARSARTKSDGLRPSGGDRNNAVLNSQSQLIVVEFCTVTTYTNTSKGIVIAAKGAS
ncbi:hypothetical protein NIES4074_64100 (plasmid) [Cylindrospermum sp. NIES-4074]|nr:hypothetical protein NIES4074_64100 [Cylindrospermum sp. NIES-4074]